MFMVGIIYERTVESFFPRLRARLLVEGVQAGLTIHGSSVFRPTSAVASLRRRHLSCPRQGSADAVLLASAPRT